MKKLLLLAGLFFLFSVASHAQTYSLPNDDANCPGNCRMIPWLAGSDIWNGGTLPTYTGVTCNGLAHNGTIGATTGTNDGPAIQACINALSSGQAAVIPAGTYFVNTLLDIPSNKVLRGAHGLNGIFLPTADATATTFVLGTAAGVTMTGGHSIGAQRTIASGYTKGSTTLVMNAGHGFAIGNWITISETPDTGIGVSSAGLDGTCSWCGQDDSNGSTGTYLMNQMVQVTNVVGNTITISRPLYYTFQATFGPVARTIGIGTTKAGFENIRLDGSAADRGREFFDIEDATFNWIKGSEDYKAGSAAKCGHVTMSWSYGNEIRDNYFHDGRSFASDRNYGIYNFLVGSDHKIENNIVRLSRHPIALEGGGSGIAILYNYFDDAEEDDPTYMAAAVLNHGAHPYMNLVEGNVISHIIADEYWGSSSHEVFFRNWMWGDETQTPEITTKPSFGYWPMETWLKNNYFSYVGNVFGITGKWGNPTWSSYTLRNSTVGSPCSVANWMYGYGCNFLGSGAYDPNPSTTSINHRNYDMKTHGVAFDEGGANLTLAADVYPPYTSKPGFLGSLPWPGIGSDITGGLSSADGKANKNLAETCFDTGVCTSIGGAPIAGIAPSSISFSAQQVGTTSAAQNFTISNTGTASLTVTVRSVSGDYAISGGSCGTVPFTVAASSSCTVGVTLTPTVEGLRSGAFSITDNAVGSPHTASVTGSGFAIPAPVVKLFASFSKLIRPLEAH